jgi:type II secretory pathway pseudopilin PulG
MAILVISLVAIGSLTTLTTSFKIIEDSRFNTLAAQVLQSHVENLRLKNWSALTTELQSPTFTIPNSDINKNLGQFTGYQSFEETRTGFRKVTIQVEWVSPNGKIHRRSYTTNFSKNGINDYYYRTF